MNLLVQPDCSCPGLVETPQAEALNQRGLTRYLRGDLAGALADFGQALRLKPDYPEALNNRGLVHHAQGNRAVALADFERALRIQPSYPEALNNRGSIRQSQGDL